MRDYQTLRREGIVANASGKAEEFMAGLSDEERAVFKKGLEANAKQIAVAFEPIIKAIQDAVPEIVKAFATIAEDPDIQNFLDQKRKIEKAKWN